MLQLPGVSPHLHGKSCLSPIEYDSARYGKHEFGTRASLYLVVERGDWDYDYAVRAGGS
jgi:hypothetical protein